MGKQLRRLPARGRAQVENAQSTAPAQQRERLLKQRADIHGRSLLHIIGTRVEQRIERERRTVRQVEAFVRSPGHRFAGKWAEVPPQLLGRQLERIGAHGDFGLRSQGCQYPLRPRRADTFAQSVDKFRRKHYFCSR